MEGRWGVADVDADKEEDADEGADGDEDVNSLSQLSQASKFKVKEGVPRIVRFSGLENDIVNGTYRLLATTRHVAKLLLPAGPWYGHRAGWCIGLVPRHRRCRPAAEGGGADRMDDLNDDGDVDDVDDDIEWRR
jgi:hypothetical protein